MTAIERFKALLANTLERVCVLEEQLELAQARIKELEAAQAQEEKKPWGPLKKFASKEVDQT